MRLQFTYTIFDLISEPPIFFFFLLLIIISSDFREGNTNLLYTDLMVTMVKTIARAHRDLCVLAVLLCCIMQSIFDAN